MNKVLYFTNATWIRYYHTLHKCYLIVALVLLYEFSMDKVRLR